MFWSGIKFRGQDPHHRRRLRSHLSREDPRVRCPGCLHGGDRSHDRGDAASRGIEKTSSFRRWATSCPHRASMRGRSPMACTPAWTRDGRYFGGWGSTVYVIADEEHGKSDSELRIVKSVDLRDKLPRAIAENVSRLLALGMTYDGCLAVGLPGLVAVLDRDLDEIRYVHLPGEAIDNGFSIDDAGGIYVVTSSFMRKLVWNGETLSKEEDKGAWKVPYASVPNERSLSRGSGKHTDPHGLRWPGPARLHLGCWRPGQRRRVLARRDSPGLRADRGHAIPEGCSAGSHSIQAGGHDRVVTSRLRQRSPDDGFLLARSGDRGWEVPPVRDAVHGRSHARRADGCREVELGFRIADAEERLGARGHPSPVGPVPGVDREQHRDPVPTGGGSLLAGVV